MSETAIIAIESDMQIAPNFIERASNRIFHEVSADAEDWALLAGQAGLQPWKHGNTGAAIPPRHSCSSTRPGWTR
jgi:hypothetical protein